VIAHIIHKGIIHEIVGSQTQTVYGQTGKVVASAICLYLSFEISDGVFKKIVFNGYLPSDLIGKDVKYVGEAVANRLKAERSPKNLSFNIPIAYFLLSCMISLTA
jgi:hypothetical protein